MNTIFLYPESLSGEFHKAKLRLIDRIDLKKSRLEPLEVIIEANKHSSHVLVGKPILGDYTKCDGKLYEKLISLNLPHEGTLSQNDKKKIISFVEMFSLPKGSTVSLEGQLGEDVKPEINWLFMPYQILLNEGNFFTTFRNMYVDIFEIVEIIKSGDLKKLNNYKGVLDIGLEGNRLIMPNYPLNEINRYPKWMSNTSMNLCFLEIYELLSSNQKIKICKYCNLPFTSSKSNEVRCKDCKDPSIYRKQYYNRNKDIERQKAKLRMRRIRSQNKQKDLLK